MTGLILLAAIALVIAMLFSPEIITRLKRRRRRAARRRDHDRFR